MKWTLAIWHLVEKIFEHAIYRHNFFYKIIMLMALEFSQKKLAEKFKRSQMHAAWNFPHTKKKSHIVEKTNIRHYPCLHCARSTVEKSGDFVISWIHEIDFCNLLNSWLRNFQVSSIIKKSSFQDSNLDSITCQARTLTIAPWELLGKLHIF